MNTLISAYSCSPDEGSEKEVGWSWVKNLSKIKNNNFTVITRLAKKKKIENKINKKSFSNINFVYYDLPKLFITLFKKNAIGNYIYIYLWQIGIFLNFKKLFKKKIFNTIHHVTLVSFRCPSFLFFYTKNFIFGPISGGEKVSYNLILNFTFKGLIFELLRSLSNLISKYSLFVNMCYFFSKKIYVVSHHTKNNILSIFHYKVKILPAIFSENLKFKIQSSINRKNLCYAGRLNDWKGIMLLLLAFKRLYFINKKYYLNIYGDGPLRNKIKKFIIANSLKKNVFLKKHLKQKLLFKKLKENDLLIFPTLRDSGGYLLIEALNHKIPVLTTNAPGPNSVIKKTNFKPINIYKTNAKKISIQLSNEINLFFKKKKIYFYSLNKSLKFNNKYKVIYKSYD